MGAAFAFASNYLVGVGSEAALYAYGLARLGVYATFGGLAVKGVRHFTKDKNKEES